jgi:hypothetical protein
MSGDRRTAPCFGKSRLEGDSREQFNAGEGHRSHIGERLPKHFVYIAGLARGRFADDSGCPPIAPPFRTSLGWNFGSQRELKRRSERCIVAHASLYRVTRGAL